MGSSQSADKPTATRQRIVDGGDADAEQPPPLSDDMWCVIMGLLDVHSLVAASLVCKSWASLVAGSERLWQNLYEVSSREG